MSNLPVLSAIVVAFGVSVLLGFWLIPLLRKIKYGQTILDIGPKWHKGKQGTPTMGGVLFIAGITLGILAGYAMLLSGSGGAMFSHRLLDHMYIALGLLMALAFGLVGFVDDYIKVVKKRNLGLSAGQKMVMQFFIAILYIAGLYLAGSRSTFVRIPFLGEWELGILYFPLAVIGIVYMTNVVNITDGIDGLCTSVTFVSSLGFLVAASVLRNEGMSVMSGALAGGCIGFLMWNFHPAKVFMGDTGSLFLGGMVVALAFGLGIPVYLALLGLIYILEGLSVVIQVSYFKLTRLLTGTPKRLFKMSPIHHHFEMCGWSESKIVVVFSLLQAVCCVVAVTAVMRF